MKTEKYWYNGTEYTITEEKISKTQARHLSSGDDIIFKAIESGELKTMYVLRREHERLSSHLTFEGASKRLNNIVIADKLLGEGIL